METIGNRLRTARESRDLSIEDASHRTRIQAIYIHGLENDDYSNFPSTTYAKSFLTLYSRFLEVDADDALELFAGGDAISLSGQGYLESVTDNIEPRRPSSVYANAAARPSASRRTRATSPGLAPLFLGVILLALVIAIPTFWILGKDSESMDDVVSKAEDLTNTTFSTTEPQAEKVETKPSAEPAQETSKPGPPAPPAAPAQKPKPASTPPVPKETKMAQVIPPSSSDRSLKTLPNAASSVITGAKPRKPVTPLRAAHATETIPKAKPVVNQTAPSSKPSSPGRPLRAVPLIARPVIDPAEIEIEATEPAEAAEIPEPEASGNRYPRPPE